MAEGPQVEIKFDQAALTTLVEKWVMEQMTEETRDAVMAQAVRHLMTAPNSSYGPRESPLQMAFNSSIEQVMRKVALDIIEGSEEIKTKVHELMGQALETFLHDTWEDKKGPFVKTMADAFASAFSKSSYE